jgi:hypothetical protein
MPKSKNELVEMLRELAGRDAVLEVVRVEPARFHLEVACSHHGRLIGKASKTLHDTEELSGWSIRVRPWSLPREELEAELAKLPSFRRIVSKAEGPDRWEVDAYFGRVPNGVQFAELRSRTGWRINPVGEGWLSTRKAVAIVAAEKPEAGISHFKDLSRDKIGVYAAQPVVLIGPGGQEHRRLCRMVEKLLEFYELGEPPPDAIPLESAAADQSVSPGEAGGEGNLTEPRCRACLGAKLVFRPVIGLAGVTWFQEPCPLCGGPLRPP